MKKIILLLLAAVFSLTAVSAQDYTDLIISEYVEGSSNNKALELYNGTNAPIDLSGYSLKKQTNGAGEYKDSLALTGTLNGGVTYVIVHSQAGAELKALADLTNGGVMGFNGNDAIGLFKGATQIDEVGVFDQTTNWGKDLGLMRNCDVKSPKVPYDATQWETLAKDDYSNLGLHCGADITGPVINKWNVISATSMSLEFNEKVESASATTITNYVINNGITVSAAVLGGDDKIVTLTFSAVEAATEYTLTVNNIKDMSENVMIEKVITFAYGSSDENNCATMAELRAKYVEGVEDNFTVTGTVVVTAIGTQRGQFWIQDTTGGILVDDPAGIITSDFTVGDNIKNFQGKLAEYYGLMQIIPSVDISKEVEATVVITPQIITLADIQNTVKMEELQSMLVKVENVTFPDAGGKFTNGKKYRLSAGSITDTLLRCPFFDVDYINTTIPTGVKDITGITDLNWNKYYIAPRFMADIKDNAVYDEYFTAVSDGDTLKYKILDGATTVSVIGVKAGYSGNLVIPETVDNDNITYSVTTIGKEAFKGCSGFTGSLTIPNSVSTIADSAFINCSGLSSIFAKGETPAVLGEDVFNGISNTIPISVPCGKEGTYKATTGWDDFTNYTEFVPYTFLVVSSDITKGTVEITKDLSCADPTYKVSFNAVAKPGYKFFKWSDEVTNSTREDVIISEDIVFTAYFIDESAETYIITFSANGGTGTTMTAQEFVANTPQNLITNTYTRTDYVFKGWATSATGAVALLDEAPYTATADAILYAVWEENDPDVTTYTVEFNANDGDGSMEDQEFTEGEAEKLKLNMFTRTNYTFKGWTTTISGEVLHSDGAYYTATADTILYAVWESGEISNELLGESKFTIYPNPVSSFLTVETTEEVKMYRIYSLQGILQGEFTSNGLNTEISVESLSSGVYLLQGVKVDGAIVSVRFVKK